MIAFWGTVVSAILSKKLGRRSKPSNPDLDELKRQQQARQQREEEEEKRRQNWMIAIGISIVLLVLSILAYQAFKSNRTKNTQV